MQRLAVEGVHMWSAWQPDRQLFFNSFLIEHKDGNIAVDPLPLDDDQTRRVEAAGGVRSIVLTNRDHERGAAALRERFGARILAAQIEAPLFSVPIDATFAGGEEIASDVVAIALPHGKTPGEVALYLPRQSAVIAGDAIIGAPAGSLSLLPDEKLEDSAAFILNLRRLWSLRLEALLLADGQSVFSGADDAIGKLLETRGGIAVNRINLDELEWLPDESPRGVYAGIDAEIGNLIGARKLGYRLAIVPPGKAYCPLHAHDREEEMFLVLEGEPTIRSSRGSIRCRTGDVIAFPTGDRGAHQLRNDSETPVKLLLLGMDRQDEVVYYPDSDKVAVDSRRLRIRGTPNLDYYAGEE
ncbi:MAG: cupin domain-containing protein [Vulcanimicrobiaceae bacterium]